MITCKVVPRLNLTVLWRISKKKPIPFEDEVNEEGKDCLKKVSPLVADLLNEVRL